MLMPIADQTNRNGRIGYTEQGSLPSEILAEIFYFCLPSDNDRLLKPARRLAPLTLSWVCGYWRNLSINTPRLWAEIVLGYYGAWVSREIPVLDLFLSRSGSSAISFKHIADLSVQLHILLDDRKVEPYTLGMCSILERVCSRSEQLRVMNVNILHMPAVEPVLSIIQRTNNISAKPVCPLLKELQIRSTHLGGDLFRLRNLGISCPQLENIALHCPAMVPLSTPSPLSSLRDLDLDFCTSIDHCMQWLNASPCLESLKVRLFSTSLETEAVQDPDGWAIVSTQQHSTVSRYAQYPIRRLERLTHLHIRGFSSSTDVGTLLSLIDAPAVNNLEVEMLTCSGDWPYVINFLRRSGPPLQRLKLSGTPMSAFDVFSCLHLLPHLKTLSIDKLKDFNPVASALTIPARIDDMDFAQAAALDSSPLCPQLEVLEVTNSPLSPEKMVELLRSRFEVDVTEELLYSVSRLKEILVDVRYARILRSHPSVVGCLVRGFILKELDTSSGFNLYDDLYQ